MAENKKILLYRIDEQAKNVIFVVIEDDERLWGNISEDMQTVLSFDEIFRDITEFRDGFLDYEQLTDELIEAINGRGAIFREILERFDDNRLNSFNFFTRYYSDTLREIFLSARQEIDKAGAFHNTRVLKKATGYVNEVSWIRNQRNRKKKGKLSADRVQRLEHIGLRWEVYEPFWQKNFLLAQEYFIEHGDLLIPQHYETDDGTELGSWLRNQRTKYRTGKLSDDRIEKLESIGMIWSPEELRWENGIMHAKAYFEEFGDLAVPQKYVSSDGYNLGTWLGTVRKNYRSGKLSAEKIEQLEGIGVVWDPIQQLWLRGYSHAEKYYQEHGGLKTGKDYVCDDGYRLGQWLVHQRQEYKAGRMKADRIEMLRRVGFEESARNSI